MNFKKIAIQLLKLPFNIVDIERSIIYVFLKRLKCSYKDSPFFVKYFENLNIKIVDVIDNLISNNNFELTVYTLVEIFETLIPVDECKENGMIYTPESIKNYILKSIVNSKHVPTICDPACGCGSFLLSAAEYIHEEYNITYNEIFQKYIFGVDIIEHNINKCIILFHLLALMSNEIINKEFNLFVGDSLTLDWHKIIINKPPLGFDIIIGNPPYVRSRNISESVRKDMKKWETCKTGNVDLYIPFYELGLSLLHSTGKLGYISPNTFIQSVNGRSLRKYLKQKKYNISIFDFRETQIFKNVTSYTCISLIDKSIKNSKIKYALLNGKSSLFDYSLTEYNMGDFENESPWRMGKKEIDDNIKKIENIGVKLDHYRIRNGLATLKNDIYFFTPIKEDKSYYYRIYEGVTYKIEKSICVNVVKPNVIKSEAELAMKMEKAIFPYNLTNNNCIIKENDMQQSYPLTYKFLLTVKETLAKRDKGNGRYPEWYAYGRTQGMLNFGSKLLLPYISEKPVAVLSTAKDVLFYCGYAVFSDNYEELIILKKILQSNVFWYYISNTSKPYSKGYMSFAKNYIKNFGVPILAEAEKNKLLSIDDSDLLDAYVQDLYKIKI